VTVVAIDVDDWFETGTVTVVDELAQAERANNDTTATLTPKRFMQRETTDRDVWFRPEQEKLVSPVGLSLARCQPPIAPTLPYTSPSPVGVKIPRSQGDSVAANPR
jgi:hypothetical protein